jgi:hypothetical protein
MALGRFVEADVALGTAADNAWRSYLQRYGYRLSAGCPDQPDIGTGSRLRRNVVHGNRISLIGGMPHAVAVDTV